MSTLNVSSIREDFPILQQFVHGKPLVYLDSAATSQKPERVIRALDTYYRTTNANIHRGIYQLAEQATEEYEAARKKVQKFINAKSWREVIWTRNATEALNLVAYSYGRTNIRAGDEIVISMLEHHSNIVPWQLLAHEKGATLKHIPVDEQGQLALDNLENLITEKTKIVAVTMMSNVTGAIPPLDKIISRAHSVGAVAVVDAAQGAPHLPLDVRALDADFLAFSGHKMLGPFVGVLYGKKALLEAMPPFLGGGDMIRQVHLQESSWNDLPHKFEAGTPAIAEAIAFGTAIDYLNALGMANVRAHEMELTHYALDKLHEVPGLRVLGPTDIAQRGGLAAFEMENIHPHDIAALLDRDAICIRAGHHCAQPLHDYFDLSATARASFYIYNTPDEIDQLVTSLQNVRKMFNK
ncbi:MAG: cysteine desulfurase [Chloroflexota bacterium]|nr:MAG: cysteine desulfurase [Chloroflexota bacterium]